MRAGLWPDQSGSRWTGGEGCIATSCLCCEVLRFPGFAAQYHEGCATGLRGTLWLKGWRLVLTSHSLSVLSSLSRRWGIRWLFRLTWGGRGTVASYCSLGAPRCDLAHLGLGERTLPFRHGPALPPRNGQLVLQRMASSYPAGNTIEQSLVTCPSPGRP
jgi:hypothetical protein